MTRTKLRKPNLVALSPRNAFAGASKRPMFPICSWCGEVSRAQSRDESGRCRVRRISVEHTSCYLCRYRARLAAISHPIRTKISETIATARRYALSVRTATTMSATNTMASIALSKRFICDGPAVHRALRQNTGYQAVNRLIKRRVRRAAFAVTSRPPQHAFWLSEA